MNKPGLQQQDTLINLVQKVLHLTVPSVEMDLFQYGGLDSLVFIDLLMSLEREFGISIDMANIELEQFKSINAMLAFVNREVES